MNARWWTTLKPGWWLAIALSVGIVTGLAWPPPPIPRAQRATEVAWSLPSSDALQRLPAGAADAIKQNLRWAGEAAVTAEDAEASSQWRLAGIVRGPSPAVLVQLATGKIEEYAQDAELPDGTRVARIDSDTVIFEREGCAQEHRLHHPPPQEDSDCVAKQ